MEERERGEGKGLAPLEKKIKAPPLNASNFLPFYSHSLSDLCELFCFNHGWILHCPGNWTGLCIV